MDNDADWEYTRHFVSVSPLKYVLYIFQHITFIFALTYVKSFVQVLFINGCFSQLGQDEPAHWPTIPHACPK